MSDSFRVRVRVGRATPAGLPTQASPSLTTALHSSYSERWRQPELGLDRTVRGVFVWWPTSLPFEVGHIAGKGSSVRRHEDHSKQKC